MLLNSAFLFISFLVSHVRGSMTVAPLVIAGNFTLKGSNSNLAQYDPSSNRWVQKPGPNLFLYGQMSRGVVWSIKKATSDISERDIVYTIGTYDTIGADSQIEYCGTGEWDGASFLKLGEGLCARSSDGPASLHLHASAVGDNDILFVGGSFSTRVWDGHRFVVVKNLARFVDGQWLPLSGGIISCRNCVDKVNALVWDRKGKQLYVGGSFDQLGDTAISPGLVVWSEENGITPMPGGLDSNINGIVNSLVFDDELDILFVAGSFTQMGGFECTNLASWDRRHNRWTCLYVRRYGMISITSMSLHGAILSLAGWAESSSTWNGQLQGKPYAIATFNKFALVSSVTPSPSPTPTPRQSGDPSAPHNSSRRSNISHEHDQRHSNSHGFKGEHNFSFGMRRLKQRRLENLQHNVPSKSGNFEQASLISGHLNGGMNHSAGKKVASRSPLDTIKNEASSRLKIEKGWNWLVGFPGTNGPILDMLTISTASDKIDLYVVGAFTGGALKWTLSPEKDASVELLGNPGDLDGLVTSIQFVNLLVSDDSSSHRPHSTNFPQNSTLLILIACVFTGIVIGIAVAIFFGKRRYYYAPIPDFEDLDKGPRSPTSEIPLTYLSGGTGHSDSIDFQKHFERAMKARHLPFNERMLIVDPKEITLVKIIGEGTFGRVWSGHWRKSSVAVKEFVFAQAAVLGGSLHRHEIIEEIVGEAGIMTCLRHPKILQLYGCSITAQAIWIVSELCERGSLRMVLNNSSMMLSQRQKLAMLIDVADGMMYLHSRMPPIIHRDLKSQNLFVKEDQPGLYSVKIGDWGSARAVQVHSGKSMTSGVGTPSWLAPEVIKFARSSKGSDVYAFGIVLWEVFTRTEVHAGLSATQIIAKVANDGLRPVVPTTCPWEDVMTRCWDEERSNRPDFSEILDNLNEIMHRTP
jgi:hypothetical protein